MWREKGSSHAAQMQPQSSLQSRHLVVMLGGCLAQDRPLMLDLVGETTERIAELIHLTGRTINLIGLHVLLPSKGMPRFQTFYILLRRVYAKYLISGGWYWDRTSGPCRVKAVLYR